MGLVEEDVVDLDAGRERLDGQRLVAFWDGRRDLFRLEDDVVAIALVVA
jgi:hypothetical protein